MKFHKAISISAGVVIGLHLSTGGGSTSQDNAKTDRAAAEQGAAPLDHDGYELSLLHAHR